MILYGRDKEIGEWVCKQLKLKPYPESMYRAVGIVENNILIGGVVWHNYHEDNWGKPLLIEVTLATIDKRWASRHNISELFRYPFNQLKVVRVQATCSRKAKRVRSTLKRLGFIYEGIARKANPFGGDAAHYSMLREECFWIGESHRKVSTITTSGTGSSSDIERADREQ